MARLSFWKFAVAVVLCAGLQPEHTCCAGDDANQKLSKAVELLNKGKASAAADLLRSLVARYPDFAQGHIVLGAALAGQVGDGDNYDAAIAEEQTALKLDPHAFEAHRILGQIYANVHKSMESIARLDEACALNPKSYAACRDLGISQMSAEKNDDALKSFKKAIALNPERPDAHIKLSALYVRMEKFKEAVAEGKKAVKCDVVNPETHLALANALLAAGDKLAAIEPYETAIQANFEKRFRNPLVAANALSGLGWAFSVKDAGERELAEAVNDQRQAIHIFPAFGPAYVRLAELLLRQGKEKEADDVYKLSVKLSNEDAGVSTAYAKFLLKVGRRDEAKNVLKGVLEKSPDYKQASDMLLQLDNERAS